MDGRINLFGLDRPKLEGWLAELGETAFRADQLMRWIYHQGVLDFDQMPNLSKKLRAKLSELACLDLPHIQTTQISTDGTRKWRLEVADQQQIETVFIPGLNRGTLCVSSQVGCALECSFCATGHQGFQANLSAADIVGQIFLARRALSEAPNEHFGRITNVVFMGMGEPLLNFEAALVSSEIAMDDLGFGLSRRRVTISTAGVVPAIQRLAEVSKVSLAISLHAPDDALRNELVPLNKKYPIATLLSACRDYNAVLGSGRQITVEYILLKDVNDQDQQAMALASLLCDLACKINLIPFNAFSGTHYRSPTPERVEAFRTILLQQGLRTTVRGPRGTDINAACGQLVGQFDDRTKRRQRYLETAERSPDLLSVVEV